MKSVTREQIEQYVERHDTLSKVPQYISSKLGIEVIEAKTKFIEFLVKEVSNIVDDKLVGVKCFEYDESKSRFVNKTIFSNFHFY